MSLVRSFTTQLKVSEEPQYVETAKVSKKDAPSQSSLVASSRQLNRNSYEKSLNKLGSKHFGYKDRIVDQKVSRGEWTREQAKEYKKQRDLNHFNVRKAELLVSGNNKGVDDDTLKRYRQTRGWSAKQIKEYKKLRAANESDTAFNQALRRTRQKHDKNAMEVFEREEELKYMKEARKINAENFIEQMRRARLRVKADTCTKDNYYPNQRRMVKYMQTVGAVVFGSISNTTVSKRQMRANRGFSKKDLLKAGLLEELCEWIHWPIRCWDPKLHPLTSNLADPAESAYSDTLVPGQSFSNIGLEYYQAGLDRASLQYRKTIYESRFVGFDLSMVQLILRCLVGGIERPVENVFAGSRLSQPQKEIEYFPFYKFVHKKGSSQIMLFQEDKEKTKTFKVRNSKSLGKSYMQWTLNPEDYNAGVGRFTRFKIWTDLGGNLLLSTLQQIKDVGDVDVFERGEKFESLFPNAVGPREFGIYDAERAKNRTSYRYRYEWPTLTRGMTPIPMLESKLMARLNYLLEVWKYNRARYHPSTLQVPTEEVQNNSN